MITFTCQIKWTFLIAICAVLIGCAAQGGPGGGPVDRTGPVLLASFPQDGANNVDLNPDLIFKIFHTQLIIQNNVIFSIMRM